MRVLVQQFYAKLLLQHYYYWAIHDVAVLYVCLSLKPYARTLLNPEINCLAALAQ